MVKTHINFYPLKGEDPGGRRLTRDVSVELSVSLVELDRVEMLLRFQDEITTQTQTLSHPHCFRYPQSDVLQAADTLTEEEVIKLLSKVSLVELE